MDLEADLQDKPIRKIEDIIDIQKANGNINVRQVAFQIPSETDSSISASLAKSLQIRLSKAKLEQNTKKVKKTRSKRRNGLTPDIISWPSDSDITVLRMKLYSNTKEKNNMRNILGDGLHQPNSSSMINLATLVLKSQPPSKQSLVEEYLLPLTSWEHAVYPDSKKEALLEVSDTCKATKTYQARCSHKDDLSFIDSDVCEDTNAKSKVARFLRLYFCPCCTCLYKLENMQKEPSACFALKESALNI